MKQIKGTHPESVDVIVKKSRTVLGTSAKALHSLLQVSVKSLRWHENTYSNKLLVSDFSVIYTQVYMLDALQYLMAGILTVIPKTGLLPISPGWEYLHCIFLAVCCFFACTLMNTSTASTRTTNRPPTCKHRGEPPCIWIWWSVNFSVPAQTTHSGRLFQLST